MNFDEKLKSWQLLLIFKKNGHIQLTSILGSKFDADAMYISATLGIVKFIPCGPEGTTSTSVNPRSSGRGYKRVKAL